MCYYLVSLTHPHSAFTFTRNYSFLSSPSMASSLNPNSPPYSVTTLHLSPPLPLPPPPPPQVYYFPILFHPHNPNYFPYYASTNFYFHKPSSYPNPKHYSVATPPKLSHLPPPCATSRGAPVAKEAPLLLSGNGFCASSQYYWRAKKASAPPPFRWRLRASRKRCSVADFRFREEEVAKGGSGGKTTVMIRNIPNWFDKRKVLELLDEHCLKENKELQQLLDGNTTTTTTTASEFDFLYLPMDFRSGSNLGYSFVNFTTPVAACRLFHELDQKSWDKHSPGSRKVCQVTYARIQGLHGLLSHFKGSIFTCTSSDYLPVRFTPSRDGLRSTSQHVVGKHVPPKVAAETRPTV